MVSRRVVRRRRRVLVGALLGLALGGVLALRGGDERAPAPAAPATPAVAAPATAPPVGDGEGSPEPQPSPSPREEPAASPDALAGVLSAEVPDAGTGRLLTVPGTRAPAVEPAGADVVQVRVQVEEGLPADGAAVAGTVMDVLQDPRGWGPDGWAFARTDDAEGAEEADVTVVVASPDLTDRLCAPLRTGGVLSCRNGDRAVLTWYRWVNGAEGYGEDRAGYRQYLVSHEVGHFLGHGHDPCSAPGEPAPVMLQQTKGLQGCTPNPWPHP